MKFGDAGGFRGASPAFGGSEDLVLTSIVSYNFHSPTCFDTNMKFLLHFSAFVAACVAVRSPPPGAIVVAKSGGDFDSVSR